MIQNKFCPNCLKVSVCSWYDTLSKLNGTKKKPVFLDVTVDNCLEYSEKAEFGEEDEE